MTRPPGYAGLQRVAAIRPDFVKLDRGLVTGSRTSMERKSVIEAIVSLSHRLGSLVIGEGVESFDDLATLAELDVDYAQGMAIAMPLSDLPAVSPDVVAACRTLRAQLLAGRVAAGFGAAQRRPAPAELDRWRVRPSRADLDVVLNAAVDEPRRRPHRAVVAHRCADRRSRRSRRDDLGSRASRRCAKCARAPDH